METALLKKLLQLQKAVRGLAPNAQGGSTSAGYLYVNGSKILDIVRPKMDELGLLLVQQVDGIDNERVDYHVKSGQKSEILTKVTMTFTWIDTESGETLPVKFGANGCNGWDKGLGSALTYAERYFLLKFFHIATDEDDVDARPVPEAQPVPARKPLVRGGKAWQKAVERLASGEPGFMDRLRAAYLLTEEDEGDLFDAAMDYKDGKAQANDNNQINGQ